VTIPQPGATKSPSSITSKTVTIFPYKSSFLPISQTIDWFQQTGIWDFTRSLNNRIPEVTMKSLLSAVVVASALIVPAVSFAQQANNDPVTRAEVRAELVAAQKAGLLYQNDTEYPKTVPQGDPVVASTQGSKDVGGVNAGSSAAGASSSVQQRLFSTYRGQ
jgi:hypothetical protein